MAVTKVTATLEDETEELEESTTTESEYSGELTAPEDGGDYSVSIAAYDDAGNIAAYSEDVEVEIWHTPKTNWTINDRFNWVDYNRIKNNILFLYEYAITMWKNFTIEDMGDDIETYATYWDVDYFNKWERNLTKINNNIFKQSIGTQKTFYENGVFIDYNELNRIESACLMLRDILERQEYAMETLSFTLGNYQGIDV